MTGGGFEPTKTREPFRCHALDCTYTVRRGEVYGRWKGPRALRGGFIWRAGFRACFVCSGRIGWRK